MKSIKSPKTTALALLARREHSKTELLQKLKHKNFEEQEILTVIDSLEQKGILSNNRFVESYIHHRRQKGIGPLRIQIELAERGIAESLIEEVLNITDNAWCFEAGKVWQKKFKNQPPKDYKTRAQHMRFLQYRGFTLEQIESVFKNL